MALMHRRCDHCGGCYITTVAVWRSLYLGWVDLEVLECNTCHRELELLSFSVDVSEDARTDFLKHYDSAEDSPVIPRIVLLRRMRPSLAREADAQTG